VLILKTLTLEEHLHHQNEKYMHKDLVIPKRLIYRHISKSIVNKKDSQCASLFT